MDVGIIGGADGPTALFVSGNPVGFILILLIAAAVGAAFFFVRRKRKK